MVGDSAAGDELFAAVSAGAGCVVGAGAGVVAAAGVSVAGWLVCAEPAQTPATSPTRVRMHSLDFIFK